MKLKNLAILPLLASVSLASHATPLETEKQKLSYIFGVQVGQGVVAEGVDIEMDAFAAGIKDMLEGNKPQIDAETAQTLAAMYQKKKQDELAKTSQLKEQESAVFLAKNATEEGVKITASGLQYKVIEAGSGTTPKSTDKVVAHYKGTLLDGTVFDSSYERKEPATFPVSGVIRGWQEALQMMKEGAKWQVVVPAELAYGQRGAGKLIGPNETLIFDIELISVAAAK